MIHSIILFAGGFSKKCDKKDIRYKDTVKDTNAKALHSMIISVISGPPEPENLNPPKDKPCKETYHATILKFDSMNLSWSQVGNMTHARASHGASVINMEDVKKFCT